jgi:hypothetical protein
MKQNLLENKINHSIHEFENLSNIVPSSDWDKNLMEKISSKQSNSSVTKFAVLIILLTLINISFLILFSKNESMPQTSQKSEELKNISNELLISPNSTKE